MLFLFIAAKIKLSTTSKTSTTIIYEFIFVDRAIIL